MYILSYIYVLSLFISKLEFKYNTKTIIIKVKIYD